MADVTRVLAVAQAPVLGGAELALLRLARLLPERGFAVAATAPAPGAFSDACASAGIPADVVPVGGLARGAWAGAIAGYPRARRALRSVQPDLVWLNGVVTLRLAPALRGARMVPYLHDLLHDRPRPWRSARFWRQTPLVLCASQAVADAAAANGAPDDRLRVVYAPVERPDPAPRPDWSGDGPVVGYVGRIEPRKGLLDLASAFGAVLERRPAARLVVVGEPELAAPGEYVAEVERCLAGLGDRVLRLGWVDNASSLMPWFDVLAVPSLEEPFGTVAAEALAAGTPVVATRSGGIEEYLTPGVDGELVRPRDEAGLAQAVVAVLSRPRPAPDSGRFAPERVADAVAAAFREALR